MRDYMRAGVVALRYLIGVWAILILMGLGMEQAMADDTCMPITDCGHEYTMKVHAVDPETGEYALIGGTHSNDHQSCAYNLGLIAGAWYNKGLVEELGVPYTVTGNITFLSFYSKVTEESPYSFYIVMICEPVDIKT